MGYYEKWHPQGAILLQRGARRLYSQPDAPRAPIQSITPSTTKVDDFFTIPRISGMGSAAAPADAAQEIRNGEITRAEGGGAVQKVRRGVPHAFCAGFFDYISIDREHFGRAADCFEQPRMDLAYFMHLADRFRSPHLWQYEGGRWACGTPFEGPSAVRVRDAEGGNEKDAKKAEADRPVGREGRKSGEGIQYEGFESWGRPTGLR